ncbi:hypothetical protein ACIHFD_58635 [Nonomuraea sp. NPDC051941]|uniref:acyl-CoA-like ligand-binding transcription factor n=1 Tax=Nonomuraea sp. NPDC051941 TaxID=3364373 RepID=UPI0037C5D99C
MREILAAREGRDPGDPENRDVAGAIVGVLMALDWAKNQDMDVVAEFDRAMANLKAGLPL